MIDAFEYIEHPFVFRSEATGIIFPGTPDKLLEYPEAIRVVVDFKMGRNAVQPAESNLQLRAYLVMEPAPDGYESIDRQHLRPSNLLRRKLCPGSRPAEALIPDPPRDDDGGKYAEEGTMLHALLADKSLSRAHLLPEQFETVEKAEAMERHFLDIVKSQMKPGWGYGAIIQPRVFDKPHIVAYSPEDLNASRQEIIKLWHASHENDAKRKASADACRYCRAVAVCPEHKAWIMAIEKVSHLPAASWTPEQWEIFLTRRSALSKFLDERYEEAKKIKQANPDAIPGWELKDGNERRVVTDIVGAWSKLSNCMTAHEFSSCCNTSIGEIERIIWEARKSIPGEKLSQKEVKKLVNTFLEGVMTTVRNKPNLVREFPE